MIKTIDQLIDGLDVAVRQKTRFLLSKEDCVEVRNYLEIVKTIYPKGFGKENVVKVTVNDKDIYLTLLEEQE